MIKGLQVASAFLMEHPVRLLLTTAATAAATCLVIWIASSYDALQRTYDEYADLALGRYQLAIAPIDLAGKRAIPETVVDALRADKRLQVVDPMWARRLPLEGLPDQPASEPSNASESTGLPTAERLQEAAPLAQSSRPGDGLGIGRRPLIPELLFMGTDAQRPPHAMQNGHWLNEITDSASEHSHAPVAVVRADVAEARNLSTGDSLKVKLGTGVRELQIVGLSSGPTLPGAGPAGPLVLTPSSAEVFVTMGLAEELFGLPREIDLIGIALQDKADLTKFRFGWAPKLSRYSTPVQFQEAFEIEEALDQESAAQNVRLQSFVATGVAMLVASLVILCSLSMGVNERIRQYAVLRAISFSRRQVGGLIVLEGLVLGLLGLVVGVGLSWLLLEIAGRVAARLLYHGISIGPWSLALASIAVVGGGFVASLAPAFQAMRVKPIDAMAPRPEPLEEARFVTPSIVIGALLLAVNPMLTFVMPPTSERGVYLAMAIGFIAMASGFVLLAPLVVRVVDRWAGPPLARWLSIDPKLVASQMSSRLWRSVGAAVSLAFGLGLFLGIHVWGWTMLEAFIPGDWAPDALAAFSSGVSAPQVDAFKSLDEIQADQCTALVVEQPRLLHDLTGSAERASITRQDNVILVGLDPHIAFGGSDPLLKLEWVLGTPVEAIPQMQSGRACVVPDHFLRETGLGLNDSIQVVPPEHPGQPIRYQIVGAVKLHGWHWQTKLTGLRPRTHRAAALVFTGYESVSQDFNLPLATHLWFNFGGSSPSDVEMLTQAMADMLDGSEENPTAKQFIASEAASSVRIVPVDQIRTHLRNTARRWLWLVSQVPLLALLIAGVGVLNVLLASVRARRWEFGVMRAIGIDHSELARAILAEGVLIALVACVLSVGFGVLAGWCGCGLAQYISFFGGLHPPLAVPLLPVFVGVASALLMGLFCAVAPAIVVGRAQPLVLLQHAADTL